MGEYMDEPGKQANARKKASEKGMSEPHAVFFFEGIDETRVLYRCE